jgi:hypothetical protein
VGRIERGVRKDLAKLPLEYRQGALAATALHLAHQMDGGEDLGLAPRDVAAYAAQLRQCVIQLREWAPGQSEDDITDQMAGQREGRLLAAVPDA